MKQSLTFFWNSWNNHWLSFDMQFSVLVIYT